VRQNPKANPMTWQTKLKKITGPENNSIINGTVQDVETIAVKEIAPIQGDALDKEICTDIPAEMENPFAGGEDELSAVSVAAQTLDPNAERIAMIANNRSPQAHAVCDSYADYEEAMGCKELATFDRALNVNLLKYGISREGKTNRVNMVLEMLKAAYTFQQQEELSTGDRAFGRKR